MLCADVECNEAFCVNVNTGQITLNTDIVSLTDTLTNSHTHTHTQDFEMKAMYTFYVVVSDRPNLSPEVNPKTLQNTHTHTISLVSRRHTALPR